MLPPHAERVAGVKHSYRHGQETKRGVKQALEEHDRRPFGPLQQHESRLLLESRKPEGKAHDPRFFILEHSEQARVCRGHGFKKTDCSFRAYRQTTWHTESGIAFDASRSERFSRGSNGAEAEFRKILGLYAGAHRALDRICPKPGPVARPARLLSTALSRDLFLSYSARDEGTRSRLRARRSSRRVETFLWRGRGLLSGHAR